MTETPVTARRQLEEGNRRFLERSQADNAAGRGGRWTPVMADPTLPPTAPPHRPFAAVLGCADARVPTEIVFDQSWNDLFVVRVAGSIVGSGALGSLQYAVAHLESLRLLVVLGHTSCMAVTVAVDAWLDPSSYPQLASSPATRQIADSILMSVRAASEFLEETWGAEVDTRPGYRAALIETVGVLNAANSARMLRAELRPPAGRSIDVVYGVYDLARLTVGLNSEEHGLFDAPAESQDFDQLGFRLAESATVRSLLGG